MINKKASILTLLVIILTFSVGCSQNKSKPEVEDNNPIREELPKDSIIEEFYGLTELDEIINFIDEKIPQVSPEDGAMMLSKLEDTQEDYLVTLEDLFTNENIVGKLNQMYLAGLDINELEQIKDEALKTFLKEIKNKGYKVETSEGMYYPVIDYEFYKSYSPYVTDDMKSYITIMAKESNQVPAKDAGLVIGWDEVIQRALDQEGFINQYPESPKRKEIESLYEKYLYLTFFGLDNTPLFDYDSQIIEADAKAEYEKIIAENTNSELLDKVAEFIEILEKNNYKLTDEVDNYRKNFSASTLQN